MLYTLSGPFTGAGDPIHDGLRLVAEQTGVGTNFVSIVTSRFTSGEVFFEISPKKTQHPKYVLPIKTPIVIILGSIAPPLSAQVIA